MQARCWKAPRTWLQSLQRMWATQQAYSSGMGVLATSSSTLRQIAARSAYDFMQMGHASCLHQEDPRLRMSWVLMMRGLPRLTGI